MNIDEKEKIENEEEDMDIDREDENDQGDGSQDNNQPFSDYESDDSTEFEMKVTLVMMTVKKGKVLIV